MQCVLAELQLEFVNMTLVDDVNGACRLLLRLINLGEEYDPACERNDS
jgi:hypothetical protein